MKELIRGVTVRTNNRWRAFFKTNEVISGIIVGNLVYDHKTAIVRLDNGNTEIIHIDWLELDSNHRLHR